ncbi:MAG: WhiB family transcriptional regulator [Acidimicrobiia bacterium]|nr:WhiB family transcriptional regulator [Acidimicrobiia bacterium]
MSQDLKQVQENGRCRSEGKHEWFFSDRPAELAQAQQVCAGCSVRVVCLEIALSEGHDWGVWGGVIFWDGQPFHRRRSRGRPRHSEAQLPLAADRHRLWEQVKSA